MSKNVWILAEQRDGKVLDVSFELLTRGIKLAQKLGVKLVAVLFGEAVSDAECNRLIERGADSVICAEAPQLATFLPEPYTACLCDLIKRNSPMSCWPPRRRRDGRSCPARPRGCAQA